MGFFQAVYALGMTLFPMICGNIVSHFSMLYAYLFLAVICLDVYKRQMSYCYSMLPVIKKLYPNKEDQVAAMKRHLEFFNTTPQLATLILGISAAMEESNANDPEFDTESINSVKVSLMGPLAGIGDSFIWGTLRIIATGVGLSLANQGNILGPILFLLIFNLPAQGLRYYLMNTGYKLGSGFLAKIQQNGLMSKLTYAASVLGLMAVSYTHLTQLA